MNFWLRTLDNNQLPGLCEQRLGQEVQAAAIIEWQRPTFIGYKPPYVLALTDGGVLWWLEAYRGAVGCCLAYRNPLHVHSDRRGGEYLLEISSVGELLTCGASGKGADNLVGHLAAAEFFR